MDKMKAIQKIKELEKEMETTELRMQLIDDYSAEILRMIMKSDKKQLV